MHRNTWAPGSLICILLSLVRCSAGDDASTSPDAGGDAAGPAGDAATIDDAATPTDAAVFVDAGDASPPDGGFLLAIEPTQINVDPGDTLVHVNVAIVRSGSFVQPVTFSITTPAGVTASDPGTVSDALASFYLSIDADAGVTDAGGLDPVVQIVGHGGSKMASTSLSIHIGTVLAIDGTSFVVPAGIDAVTVQAWGAGGSGGLQFGTAFGGSGGGGGYATENIPVVVGETLTISAGKVFANPLGSPVGSGDYSSVARSDGGLLLVAAGGGGGGPARYNGIGFISGWPGSAGGGLTGETPNWLSDAAAIWIRRHS